ncbi:MAG TPA: hypothetical protein VHU14_09595 [Solirubrobacterales bacterium]|nr:hypothetical protein [Solirubrobacterales bacterium]
MLILRDTLADCLEGVRGDLETPEAVKDPEQAREEADAYQRLLAGLARGKILVPDAAALSAVRKDRNCRRRGEQLRRDCCQP